MAEIPRRPDEMDDQWAPPIPDALDYVIEVASMMAVFASERFERVHSMHREALDDAARHGLALTDVVERGIRLELAAALRITERSAGDLLARADVLVATFPRMLDALRTGRTTERHAEIFADAMVGVEPEFHDVIAPRAVALAEVEGWERSDDPFTDSSRRFASARCPSGTSPP